MAAIELHRTRDRRHLAIPVRVERLEEDADTFEVHSFETNQRLDKLNARMLGVLISVLLVLFTLVGNLAVLLVRG